MNITTESAIASSSILAPTAAPLAAAIDSDESDNYPMPSPEQVARNMDRRFKMPDVCRHQQERESQIIEGRKMARAETHGSHPRQAPPTQPKQGAPRDASGKPRHRHPGKHFPRPQQQSPRLAQAAA